MITNQKISLFFATLLATVGCRATTPPADIVELEGKYGSIIYESPQKGGTWEDIFYKNGSYKQQLFLGQSSYFESSQESDFSHNGAYFRVNRVLHGTIDIGKGQEEEYAKYYCSFIDMHTGCVVRQETGSFCGGSWSSDGDDWLWDGEQRIIDLRKVEGFSLGAPEEYFFEIGGTKNIDICTQSK